MTIGQLITRVARDALSDPVPEAPPTEFTVAPETAEDAAAVMAIAAEHQMRVLFWGGGSHQGMGYRVEPDIVVTSHKLDSIVDWQAEDLTIVVQPGVLVADLEARLAAAGQTAVLPEIAGAATVGGVVAAGVSGWRRLRYGPIRDRMLEVRLATGDGRVIRGGGRIVKNVTGYDIPRLATGSFGSLGMITEVCLKLWPLSVGRATVTVDDPVEAFRAAYRPLAVIETNNDARVFLAGTPEELEAQAERIGGVSVEGHDWPQPLTGSVLLVLRMPQGKTATGVAMVSDLGGRFQAGHGVGEIWFTADGVDVTELELLRQQAEAHGGSLVVAQAPAELGLDPWGSAPGAIELQRRVKAAFDPRGIANPGILPGGV
jgi:glycolate oxidase FAD binding subunit